MPPQPRPRARRHRRPPATAETSSSSCSCSRRPRWWHPRRPSRHHRHHRSRHRRRHRRPRGSAWTTCPSTVPRPEAACSGTHAGTHTRRPLTFPCFTTDIAAACSSACLATFASVYGNTFACARARGRRRRRARARVNHFPRAAPHARAPTPTGHLFLPLVMVFVPPLIVQQVRIDAIHGLAVQDLRAGSQSRDLTSCGRGRAPLLHRAHSGQTQAP